MKHIKEYFLFWIGPGTAAWGAHLTFHLSYNETLGIALILFGIVLVFAKFKADFG